MRLSVPALTSCNKSAACSPPEPASIGQLALQPVLAPTLLCQVYSILVPALPPSGKPSVSPHHHKLNFHRSPVKTDHLHGTPPYGSKTQESLLTKRTSLTGGARRWRGLGEKP